MRGSPGLGDFPARSRLAGRARDHEGAQQRELADREETARLVDLRIDFLRALEEGVNTTAASIGELEDRMERANLLPRAEDAAGPFAR